jgi:hypothetical protein
MDVEVGVGGLLVTGLLLTDEGVVLDDTGEGLLPNTICPGTEVALAAAPLTSPFRLVSFK